MESGASGVAGVGKRILRARTDFSGFHRGLTVGRTEHGPVGPSGLAFNWPVALLGLGVFALAVVLALKR